MKVSEALQSIDKGINISINKNSSLDKISTVNKYSDKSKVDTKYLDCDVVTVTMKDSKNVSILL